METTLSLAAECEPKGMSDDEIGRLLFGEEFERVEKQIVSEIKKRHTTDPKYKYSEESQQSIYSRFNVSIVDLEGTYVRTADHKARLLHAEGLLTAEAFAMKHLESIGYKVMATESRPFHVLYGTFLWLLFQDPADTELRLAGFGERSAFDRGVKGDLIYTLLPPDFGVAGYYSRRLKAIQEYFSTLLKSVRKICPVWHGTGSGRG